MWSCRCLLHTINRRGRRIPKKHRVLVSSDRTRLEASEQWPFPFKASIRWNRARPTLMAMLDEVVGQWYIMRRPAPSRSASFLSCKASAMCRMQTPGSSAGRGWEGGPIHGRSGAVARPVSFLTRTFQMRPNTFFSSYHGPQQGRLLRIQVLHRDSVSTSTLGQVRNAALHQPPLLI